MASKAKPKGLSTKTKVLATAFTAVIMGAELMTGAGAYKDIEAGRSVTEATVASANIEKEQFRQALGRIKVDHDLIKSYDEQITQASSEFMKSKSPEAAENVAAAQHKKAVLQKIYDTEVNETMYGLMQAKYISGADYQALYKEGAPYTHSVSGERWWNNIARNGDDELHGKAAFMNDTCQIEAQARPGAGLDSATTEYINHCINQKESSTGWLTALGLIGTPAAAGAFGLHASRTARRRREDEEKEAIRHEAELAASAAEKERLAKNVSTVTKILP